MRCGGHLLTLRMVRLQTLPSLRKDSRRRIAGGEERLGTRSIYTGTKPSIEQSPNAVRTEHPGTKSGICEPAPDVAHSRTERREPAGSCGEPQ